MSTRGLWAAQWEESLWSARSFWVVLPEVMPHLRSAPWSSRPHV